MSVSKEDKLRAAIEAARKARSNKIGALQAELAALKKKGQKSEKASDT
jgi:hypothetical protein